MHELPSVGDATRHKPGPLACFAAVGLALVLLPLGHGSLPAADPLPIRRLLISPERLPLELQRTRHGTLVQMPRDEFEARVLEAARAGAALTNPPRLAEARYRANLIDTALVGTAQWTILHSGTAAGVLPLQPLNLALRQARIDQQDAILGDLDGKSLGLLVERSGTHTVSLGWTARGDLGPAGLRFELKVPGCVLTSFDLELPADRVATVVGDSCLLSGPQPGSAPDHRSWRLLCGGASPVNVLIRRTSSLSESPPLVLARLQTRQKLAADLLEADYDFSLEILHGGIRELVCEGDPALHPTAVSAGSAEIEGWEVRPGPTPGAPFALSIRLRERFEGSLLPLRIHCLAAAAFTKRWMSPALRLKGGVFQGETLSVQLSPDLRLEDWQAGSFELLKTATESDGGQLLTLQSGLRGGSQEQGNDAQGSAATSIRPSARIQVQQPEYRARQVTWLQISPDSASLTVQIDYEIVRGRLFRLPVLLPANWSLDRVDLNPRELLWNWTPISAERGQTYLLIELQRALECPNTVQLTLHLRPVNAWPIFARENKAKSATFSVPFPEIIPQRTRLWTGGLAIRIDPCYVSTVRTSSPAAAAESRIEDPGSGNEDPVGPRSLFLEPLSSLLKQSPWGGQPPDYLYSFRQKAVSGTLELRLRSPRVRAHCTSEVVLASGRAAVLTRLLLQPDVGSPESIDLLVSAPVSGSWNWRSEGGRNAVKSMHRLPAVELLPRLLALGAGTPLQVVSLLHLPLNRGTWWRITLDQPLREPLLLETTFDLVGAGAARMAPSGVSTFAAGTAVESLILVAAGSLAAIDRSEERRWEIPLLTIPSAEPMDGEVQLYLAGTGEVQIEKVGLGEVASTAGGGVSTPWHTFRYNRLPVSLVLRGGIAAPNVPAPAVVEYAHLRTFVEPAGQLLNYYSFQVRNWKQRSLPLRLPAGAQLVAAKVDGRWIVSPVTHETTPDGLVVELPVATETVTQCFEVAYTLEYRTGILWTRVDAPVPVLPVVAIASRRTWCLPPGCMPLRDSRLQRNPGPSWEFGGSNGNALRLSFFTDPRVTFSPEAWRQRQERLLGEADTYLYERARQDKNLALGEALHYLTYEYFKGQQTLVLDAVALREAGLRPVTPIQGEPRKGRAQRARPEGESLLHSLDGLGLICIPCRPAPLLTTHRRWAVWQGVQDRTDSVSSSIETAVSEAIAHGHDPSGRFQSTADWLRDWETECGNPHGGETPNGNASAASLGSVASLPHPESWTEWEPLAGTVGEDSLVVLRQDTLWGVAWTLAGMLLLAWWWARRRAALLRYRLTLFWLAASVLGLLWLPASLRTVFWWPMLTGIAVAVAWYLATGLQSRIAASATMASAAASLLAVTIAIGLPGQAAAPPSPLLLSAAMENKGRVEGSPYTVWLVPGPPEAADKLNVLVPPELLTQLQSLARRGAAGLQGALLLHAKYQATVGNGSADFEAEFQVQSFTDQPTLLALPLSGVELREVLLDGSAAYPAALAAPQSGYSLKVQGRGPHSLRVRFGVRITGTAEEQDLRFTIPELAQSQLAFLAPDSARYLQAVLGRGVQRVSIDPKGMRLDADLGRVSTVQVHWRQESRQLPPAAVELKEVYYWDLQRSGSRLLGLYDYTVTRGAITELAAVLPENMEVRQVETVATGTGGLGPRLKNWTLSGPAAQRRLRLEFQGPVTNNVQVLLELVPRLPLAHRPVLSLPTPEGVSFSDGFLAYRVQGLLDSVAESHGVLEIEPTAFEGHWQPAGTEYPGLPTRAYRLLRAAGGMPYLRLDLHRAASRSECVQDVTWHVGPQRAEVRARAKLTGAQKELALVEWEIPAEVIVTEVRGADVRNWSRTASRLQVWLQRSVTETSLELAGWRAGSANKPRAAFQLPCFAFPSATPHPTFVHVVAEKGWTLQPERLLNLSAPPESMPSGNDRSYVSQRATYGGVFHLRPASTHADLLAMSLIEVRERQVTFSAMLDYEIGQHKSRMLTVRLRNWDGQEVRLEAPPTVSRGESRRDPLARTWTLELPPALTGRIQLQLTGTLAVDSDADVVMPEVSVDEAASSERWLAAVGQQLQPKEQRGLIPVADAAQALNRWPAVADRLRQLGGLVWKLDAPDWRLRLRSHVPFVESRPAQLFLEEQAAAVVDGRRWLHEAIYSIYQESGTHLGFLLPRGATLVTASLDGRAIAPLQAGSERFWLALTGGSGVRALRLYWVYNADRERLDVPRLEKPRLENIRYAPVEQRNPTFWTVHIPPGYRLVQSGGIPRQSSLAERALGYAAAQLRATEILANHAAIKADDLQGSPLLTAQLRFYRHHRDAQYELTFPDRLGQVEIDSLATRLRKLQADNKQLSRAHHFEAIRDQAEAQAASPRAGISRNSRITDRSEGAGNDDLLARQGTPTYWQVSADSGDPRVRLIATQTEQTRQAFGYSGFLLILFVIGWIVPSHPRVLVPVWASWPEQIVLLGGLIWLVGGANLLFGLCVFLGVAARMIYLGRWVVARFRRPTPATGGSGVSSAT